MEEVFINLINNIVSSFDVAFCVVVNIATYIAIRVCIDSKRIKKVTTWNKRLVFVIVSLVLGSIYYATGSDGRTLVNSIILAPVSWSWIFKPICAKYNIDYKRK